MSYSTKHIFKCDSCHREVSYVRVPLSRYDIPERQMNPEGWVAVGGFHFCPAHTAKVVVASKDYPAIELPLQP